MSAYSFFVSISSERIVELVNAARKIVCYVAPSVNGDIADALLNASKRLGPEKVSINLDFCEKVFRYGYGTIEAVEKLNKSGRKIINMPNLRCGIIISDSTGYEYTPTPLYLEAEPESFVKNALLLSKEQVAEALVRYSSSSTEVAKSLSRDSGENENLEFLPCIDNSEMLEENEIFEVSLSLENVPPVNFDLARQVRVFEPYLQYVDLNLVGASLQRHRMPIPPSILAYGKNSEIETRLKTTFDLIDKNDILSSKKLEDSLNLIRKNYTKSLKGKKGRVVLKAAKPDLSVRIQAFIKDLKSHQEMVEKELQKHLDLSRDQIVSYY